MFEKGKQKKLTIAFAVILIILLLVVAGLSIFMFNFALNPHSDYTMIDLVPLEEFDDTEQEPNSGHTDALEAFYAEAAMWFESGQERTLISEDNLTLKAHFFPQTGSHRYAILCHGYSGNSSQMSGYAKQFYALGCSVLVPDARAHGESEGSYYGMGWLERKDILGWANQIISSDPQAEIVLFGVSMGGATVMMTAGEQLPEQIKCIVEDCGYTSVWDEFSLQLANMFNAPEFPLMYTTDLVCRLRAGYGFKEASSVEQLKKAEVPMLFIHGEEDTFVPYAMLDQVYSACASAEKEKLTVPGAGHGAAASADPELYWNTIETFISKYLR